MPKSSAEASRDPSCDLHTALMSVPSAPSGQIPERDREGEAERGRHGEKKRESVSERMRDKQSNVKICFMFRLQQNAVQWFDQRSVWTQN